MPTLPRTRCILIVALALATMLAACGSDETDVADAPRTQQNDGAVAAVGPGQEAGVTAALDESIRAVADAWVRGNLTGFVDRLVAADRGEWEQIVELSGDFVREPDGVLRDLTYETEFLPDGAFEVTYGGEFCIPAKEGSGPTTEIDMRESDGDVSIGPDPQQDLEVREARCDPVLSWFDPFAPVVFIEEDGQWLVSFRGV